MANDQSLDRGELLSLTTELVAAHVSNNATPPESLAPFIQAIFDKLSSLGGETPVVAEITPAVPIRRSVTDDYLICLEDGKKLKMLKRHLMTAYGMTPEEYRAKWGLKPDYPMVAPNYSQRRHDLAKQIGLGHRPKSGPTRRRATAA